MLNNTTAPPAMYFLRLCSFDGDAIVKQTPAFKFLTISIAIVIALLSPIAVAGNALILAAICKTPSLKTPSYILLGFLAFADLFTGLVTQPFHVTGEFICLEEPRIIQDKLPFLTTAKLLVASLGTYLVSVTILILTFMSIERWLHMAHRSMLTGRRAFLTAMLILLGPIPIAVLRSFQVLKGTHGIVLPICFALLLVCFVIMSMAYFKVFRIIRRHQQQVHTNASPQNQSAINLTKYKKSVDSILLIVALFYLSYLPCLIFLSGLHDSLQNHSGELAFKFSVLLMCLSSSLNPVIFLWRMNDIRKGVKELLRNFRRQDN